MKWLGSFVMWCLTLVIGAICVLIALAIWVIVHGYDSGVGVESLSPFYAPPAKEGALERPASTGTALRPPMVPKGPGMASKAKENPRSTRARGTHVCRNRPASVQCEGAACYHDLGLGPCRGLSFGND
jgi:hypothetical protein